MSEDRIQETCGVGAGGILKWEEMTHLCGVARSSCPDSVHVA